MSLIRVNKLIKQPSPLLNFCYSKRPISSSPNTPPADRIYPSEADEYTATPHYPEILDLSRKAKLERQLQAECETIKNVSTVEEKQIKLNMPYYYGFKTHMLRSDDIPYDALKFVKYVTRSHLIENETPSVYSKISTEELDEGLKNDILEAVAIELDGYRRNEDLKKSDLSEAEKEDLVAKSIVGQVHRVVFNKLSRSVAHLHDTQADISPRIEAFWPIGGIKPTKQRVRALKGTKRLDDRLDEPTNRNLTCVSAPFLTVRAPLPLSPLTDRSDFAVEPFTYDPRVLGAPVNRRRIVNVPGYFPGDAHPFALVSYHGRGHLRTRTDKFGEWADNADALHAQAMLASYSWLHSIVNMLGFTSYNDVTYPLVGQAVLTNGKQWAFYAYQLNTIFLHSTLFSRNDGRKANVCYALGDLTLFEKDKDSDKLTLNDDALALLLKFYKNEPRQPLGVNLRPFVNPAHGLVAEYEDASKREWLEREYKFLTSNRDRFKDVDEIYNWEKIYKIDHKTRFMEKRLRFFELFKSPSKRRLNDRLPRYVPRALRPDLPRHKGRYLPEYWP